MMALTTTISGRALALASSLVVHASVVVALGGSRVQTPARASSPSVTLEIAVLEQPPSEVPHEAAPVPVPAQRAVRPHGHTHAYPVAEDHAAHPHDAALVHAPLALPSEPAPPSFALSVPSAAPARPPAFALAVGHSHSVSSSSADPSGSTSADGGEVVGEAGVDSPARLLVGAPPVYPRAAAEAALEADVSLELVVDAHGRVVSARLLEHPGYGLAEAALAGVHGYRFRPAMLHGRPTAVRMKWTMLFRLQ